MLFKCGKMLAETSSNSGRMSAIGEMWHIFII
jgi:hypothetical protein